MRGTPARSSRWPRWVSNRSSGNERPAATTPAQAWAETAHIRVSEGLNGTQAAICAGYSKRSAASIAFEVLKKSEIQAEIQRRLEKLGMSADEVLIELAWIGRANVKDMFGHDRKMLHPEDMPESIRRAIAGIDVKARTIKVRFWSKTEAAIWRESITSFFVDRSEVTGNQVNVNALVRDEDLARYRFFGVACARG